MVHCPVCVQQFAAGLLDVSPDTQTCKSAAFDTYNIRSPCIARTGVTSYSALAGGLCSACGEGEYEARQAPPPSPNSEPASAPTTHILSCEQTPEAHRVVFLSTLGPTKGQFEGRQLHFDHHKGEQTPACELQAHSHRRAV